MGVSTHDKALLDFLQDSRMERNEFLADEGTCTPVEELFVNMAWSHLSTMSNLRIACNFDIKETVKRTVGRVMEAWAKDLPGEALSQLSWAPTQGS